ncbi:MAG: hypothetical protein JRH20_14400 [Deltaproteobacteria bacterium]|nr:hypothetical protein [Deltaproteobacteria bacterium]
MTCRKWGLSVGFALLMANIGCRSEQAQQVGSKRQGLATTLDPLIRLPGTQPGQASLEDAKQCVSCHGGYNPQVEPAFNWQGSMMAQAGRDPLFWTAMTVAVQDSMWAVGRPNATDLCERCHFPQGWLAGRSDPTNASAMTGGDFDGVQCDACHKLFDPHFETTRNGTREGSDWLGYWDESNASATPSAAAAAATYADDAQQASAITYFNGNDFYTNNVPREAGYTEATGGHFYYVTSAPKRASFADPGAKHSVLYSRYHKSRYFCGTCHDISNAPLANLAHIDLAPGDGTTVLPSESQAPHSYYHLERTFSEFMLSAYGRQGGATGIGPFAPTVFTTSQPGNAIASCQDCHMRDVSGPGADKNSAVFRPDDSVEHPKSGQPLHDLTGGNIFISHLLASAVSGSANYNATNAQLLGQGATVLTLDLRAGLGIDPVALLAGVERAKQQLQLAASINDLVYDGPTRSVSFKVQNQTGHKLISGFPEGRRMFVNVRAYEGGLLVHEVNPYDATVGTLCGLDASLSPSSPALLSTEEHISQLVYEMNPSSSVTGESKTFHFLLVDGRYKDNRIPPRGFDVAAAPQRLVDAVWAGASAPTYFSAAEYAGGYDDVSLTLPVNADRVEVVLYYQVTSREYIEFLRHQIAGTPSRQTLPAAAYIAQTDPFFDQLRAWGETMWQLWDLNKDVPGAAPFAMASAAVGVSGPPPCDPPTPTMLANVSVGVGEVSVGWADEHTGDAQVTGYKLYYDQAGKSLLLATLAKVTTYRDSGLTGGQTYCYKVTATYADCESPASNVVCGVPLGIDARGQYGGCGRARGQHGGCGRARGQYGGCWRARGQRGGCGHARGQYGGCWRARGQHGGCGHARG